MKSCRKSFSIIFRNIYPFSKFAKPFIYGALILPLLLILPVSQVFAADIAVDATCSMEQAINSANDDGSRDNDTDYGDCETGSDRDTITLTADVTLPGLLPEITSAIIIEGKGFFISGDDKYRVLHVARDGNLEIRNLIVTNGRTIQTDDDVLGGGGILSFGTLTVNNSIIKDTKDNTGGGSRGGGGINSRGILTINNSLITGNEAFTAGGGVALEPGSTGNAIIRNTVISDNVVANSWGGGVFNNMPTRYTLTIENSSIINNEAISAGGIMLWQDSGKTIIRNTTIAGNEGTRAIASRHDGGGIAARSPFEFIHVTIVNNHAARRGGGIALDPGRLPDAGDKIMVNSILANNTADGGRNNCGSPLGTIVGSLIEDTDQCGTGAVSADPMLGELVVPADGSPPYYPLLAGSPAIDAADTDKCDELNPKVDQRGAARPDGTACDIGAYEGVWYPPTPIPESAPAAIPRPPRVDHTCPTLLPGIEVTDLTGATQCLRIDAGGIGIPAVIERGVVDAVDVWSYIGAGTRICFMASGGSFSFLDAATAPRTVRSLPLHLIDGKTCTFINSPGSVVLNPGVGIPQPVPEVSQPVEVESSPQNWENCQVVTTDALNLRESADGEIMTGLAAGITLDVVSRADGWVEVDFYGRSGWVSAEYVRLTGECG